jgi:hypothetical protein
MRRTAILLVAVVALGACSTFKKTFGLNDSTPAHVSPRSTSIYGSWILDTDADSTAFIGADVVELTLDPGRFTIRATYPNQAPVVVSGTASLTDEGALTLIPTDVSSGLGSRGALVMEKGRQYTLMASAAGNTLVFAPPTGTVAAEPSSVWHKKSVAEAAGKTPASTTAGQKP